MKKLTIPRPKALPVTADAYLLAETFHLRLYATSWAYARVVDELWWMGEWEGGRFAVDALVGRVVADAEEMFREQIVFGARDVRRALQWLSRLEPPVIRHEGKRVTFRRRYFCYPSTFLVAVKEIYRRHGIAFGVRMFLREAWVEQLCRLCLLDPEGLRNVLEMTKRATDYQRGGVFDYGTQGGFGGWILLTQNFAT